MAIILHIDTATEYGAVGVSIHQELVAVRENNNQKEHASFLHPAIDTIIKASGISLREVDAVAVTIGPGSYTGLRVGLTAAKGLCYVLGKPLIAVDTLLAMAIASIEDTRHIHFEKPVLYAPMIDARRMEVYTGLYTSNADVFAEAKPLILNAGMFANEFEMHHIIFSGSGSKKLATALPGLDFFVSDAMHSIHHVSLIANKDFLNNEFVNPAYCEPFYLKPFHSPDFVKK